METEADILKEQVLAQLTRLSTLVLQQAYFHPDGFEALKHLPALRQLQLLESHHVPDCLSQITQLEALVLWDAGREDVREEEDAEAAAAAINAALLQLTRLTSLCIHNVPACRSLPALAGLEQLQRLCLTDCLERGSLPAGPWCSRLRELGASLACLRRSGGALAEAEQLRRLVALGRAADPGAAFVCWVAAHPPLQRLDLYSWRAAPMPLYLARPALERAVQQLNRERPQLRITQQLTSPLKNDFSRSFLLDAQQPIV